MKQLYHNNYWISRRLKHLFLVKTDDLRQLTALISVCDVYIGTTPDRINYFRINIFRVAVKSPAVNV